MSTVKYTPKTSKNQDPPRGPTLPLTGSESGLPSDVRRVIGGEIPDGVEDAKRSIVGAVAHLLDGARNLSSKLSGDFIEHILIGPTCLAGLSLDWLKESIDELVPWFEDADDETDVDEIIRHLDYLWRGEGDETGRTKADKEALLLSRLAEARDADPESLPPVKPAGKSTGTTSKHPSGLRWGTLNLFWDSTVSTVSLGLPAIAVWNALYRHAQPDGRVSVSSERLREMTNMCERSVTNALAELRDKRLLETIKVGGINRGASVRRLWPKPFPVESKVKTPRKGAVA